MWGCPSPPPFVLLLAKTNLIFPLGNTFLFLTVYWTNFFHHIILNNLSFHNPHPPPIIWWAPNSQNKLGNHHYTHHSQTHPFHPCSRISCHTWDCGLCSPHCHTATQTQCILQGLELWLRVELWLLHGNDMQTNLVLTTIESLLVLLAKKRWRCSDRLTWNYEQKCCHGPAEQAKLTLSTYVFRNFAQEK